MAEADGGWPWVRLGISLLLGLLILVALRPWLSALPTDLSLSVLPALGFVAALVVYVLLRSARWVPLVRPLVDAPAGTVLSIGLVGSMWIALLPLRLGEFVRPALLSRVVGVDFSRGLGTVLVERVTDGVVVCAVFFATRSAQSSGAIDALVPVTTAVMATFATVLLGLLVLAWWPAFGERVAGRLLAPLSPRLSAWAASTVRGVAEGLAALPRGSELGRFLALTVAYWMVNALAISLLARACGLDLPITATLQVLAVMNVALLVPGGPAQLGVFQGAVALGLSLVADADTIRHQGSTFTFYLYVGQLGALTIAGAWAQRRLGPAARPGPAWLMRRTAGPSEPSPPP